MSGGKIVRKRDGRGEVIRFLVFTSTKTRWEEIGKSLASRGYEIDTDQAVRRIIRSLEVILKEGAK